MHLSDRRHWWSAHGARALEILAKDGISFACRRYRYINHKADGNGACYFLAEVSTGREASDFHSVQTHEAVSRLGRFTRFHSVPRMVARIALAFSRSQTLALVRPVFLFGLICG